MSESSISPLILAALQRVEPVASFSPSSGSRFQFTSSNNIEYFAKEGSPPETDQYDGEARSLRAMYAASPGICPKLFESSVDASSKRPVFVSEYKKFGPLNQHSAATLGIKLAEMHTKGTSPTGLFGFDVPTYCGATRLENGWFDTWEAAFDRMISGLLERLKEKDKYTNTCELGGEVRKNVIPRLLGSLRIKPSLLHGDLWSGNVGTDYENGQPIIFDPSSCYGHNEADLAISRMFGGFPPIFFTTYHEQIPRSEPASEYDQRITLYELFHYLNHTVLFGSSYETPAKQRMEQLLRYVKENKTVPSL